MNFEIENDEGIREKMEGEAAFIPDHGSDVCPNTALQWTMIKNALATLLFCCINKQNYI
jgi:hypothetical protein